MTGPGLEFERAEASGGAVVMGVDEAGRGPLAGPVFAAAVAIPSLDTAAALAAGQWKGINDSKKLSPARRERLAEAIKTASGVYWAVDSASAAEIDRLNILGATHLAMKRASLALAARHGNTTGSTVHYRIIVDGLAVPTLPFPSKNIVKGDAKSVFIAAASILAKTARDAYCMEMDLKYPEYGFAVHKGYPTAFHLDKLAAFGPCPEHRRSFGPVREQLLPLFG